MAMIDPDSYAEIPAPEPAKPEPAKPEPAPQPARISVKTVLEHIESKDLRSVVVVGFDENGRPHVASSEPGAGDLLLMLEAGKAELLKYVLK